MIWSEAVGTGPQPGVRRPRQITMCVPSTIPDPPASLHQLCLNESPFGPLPAVSLALANSIRQTNRYPEFYPERLTELIADRLGLATGSVAVGSGSVGVALQLLQAVIEPGDAMVYGWRNFDAYPLLARMAGARPVEVPLRPDGRQDLDAMASPKLPGGGMSPTALTWAFASSVAKSSGYMLTSANVIMVSGHGHGFSVQKIHALISVLAGQGRNIYAVLQ